MQARAAGDNRRPWAYTTDKGSDGPLQSGRISLSRSELRYGRMMRLRLPVSGGGSHVGLQLGLAWLGVRGCVNNSGRRSTLLDTARVRNVRDRRYHVPSTTRRPTVFATWVERDATDALGTGEIKLPRVFELRSDERLFQHDSLR
jgi:hypothetical protein